MIIMQGGKQKHEECDRNDNYVDVCGNKNEEKRKNIDVEDGKPKLKNSEDDSEVSYDFVAGDETGQPGYFITKSGREFTAKKFLAANELMQDIKNYSLETGQSVEELLRKLNEVVTDSSDDDEAEELKETVPPIEPTTAVAKTALKETVPPNEATTLVAKPALKETVPPNEPTTAVAKPTVNETVPPNETTTVAAKPTVKETVPPNEPAAAVAKPALKETVPPNGPTNVALMPAYNPLVTNVEEAASKLTPSKSANDVILVYPFIDGEAIEDAAKGLFLGEDPATCSAAHLLQLQEEKTTPRSHFNIITRDDLNRVKPGVYFNDVLVNFWLQWITRKELLKDALVWVFNSHFYTKMVKDGVKGVCAWTTQKGIDIFSKKNVNPTHQ